MYQLLTKRGQMLAFIIGAALVIIHILLGSKGNYDFGLYAGIGLTAIAFVVMLIGIAKYFAQNPKQIRVLIGFLIVFAFVGLMIMMASGTPDPALESTVSRAGITPGVYKYVSGSINATIILLALAFLGLIVSEIVSLFK